MKVLADATLPYVTDLFPLPFKLSLYHSQDELLNLLPSHDILVCRSTLKVTAQLLAGSKLLCIATASSGIDHIESDYLAKKGIQLFDAKGCNAQAVADYVVATLAFLSLNNLIIGQHAGIIGVGEVGSRVEARLKTAGFEVKCYDPIREHLDKQYPYCTLAQLTHCDLLCIHANLHETPPYPSANLLSADFLNQLKPGTTIINAARGGIIDEKALVALQRPITYCTDVYSNEPSIDAKVIDYATLCTPHIAGHSIEAKEAAVVAISEKIHHYFGLTVPSKIIHKHKLEPVSSVHKTWQNNILALYNPFEDTTTLKAAGDKTRAFLTQRSAHQHRHDFSCYDISQFDLKTKLLMGL